MQVPGSTVEKSIEQELDKQGAPNAQANCPDTITVKLDTTVTCDLSGASGQAAGTVTFTFSDASGTVDPSSVRDRLTATAGREIATREERTMEASELDVLGPVDYLVVEFPAEKANFSGEMAAELIALVDRELVRVLDLLLLRKDADGSVEAAELADVDESDVGALRALEADLAMLLAEEDVEEIGKALEPGSYAAVLVYENSWAGPFASSIRRAGGQLVANGRIPTQALLAAIEADEETDEEGA